MIFASGLVKFVCALFLAVESIGDNFFAPALAAFRFALGFFHVTATRFFLHLATSLCSSRFRFQDLRQRHVTPLQFIEHFIAATASERGIPLGVELLGLPQLLLYLHR
jgi:hypothetical protein